MDSKSKEVEEDDDMRILGVGGEHDDNNNNDTNNEELSSSTGGAASALTSSSALVHPSPLTALWTDSVRTRSATMNSLSLQHYTLIGKERNGTGGMATAGNLSLDTGGEHSAFNSDATTTTGTCSSGGGLGVGLGIGLLPVLNVGPSLAFPTAAGAYIDTYHQMTKANNTNNNIDGKQLQQQLVGYYEHPFALPTEKGTINLDHLRGSAPFERPSSKRKDGGDGETFCVATTIKKDASSLVPDNDDVRLVRKDASTVADKREGGGGVSDGEDVLLSAMTSCCTWCTACGPAPPSLRVAGPPHLARYRHPNERRDKGRRSSLDVEGKAQDNNSQPVSLSEKHACARVVDEAHHHKRENLQQKGARERFHIPRAMGMACAFAANDEDEDDDDDDDDDDEKNDKLGMCTVTTLDPNLRSIGSKPFGMMSTTNNCQQTVFLSSPSVTCTYSSIPSVVAQNHNHNNYPSQAQIGSGMVKKTHHLPISAHEAGREECDGMHHEENEKAEEDQHKPVNDSETDTNNVNHNNQSKNKASPTGSKYSGFHFEFPNSIVGTFSSFGALHAGGGGGSHNHTNACINQHAVVRETPLTSVVSPWRSQIDGISTPSSDGGLGTAAEDLGSSSALGRANSSTYGNLIKRADQTLGGEDEDSGRAIENVQTGSNELIGVGAAHADKHSLPHAQIDAIETEPTWISSSLALGKKFIHGEALETGERPLDLHSSDHHLAHDDDDDDDDDCSGHTGMYEHQHAYEYVAVRGASYSEGSVAGSSGRDGGDSSTNGELCSISCVARGSDIFDPQTPRRRRAAVREREAAAAERGEDEKASRSGFTEKMLTEEEEAEDEQERGRGEKKALDRSNNNKTCSQKRESLLGRGEERKGFVEPSLESSTSSLPGVNHDNAVESLHLLSPSSGPHHVGCASINSLVTNHSAASTSQTTQGGLGLPPLGPNPSRIHAKAISSSFLQHHIRPQLADACLIGAASATGPLLLGTPPSVLVGNSASTNPPAGGGGKQTSNYYYNHAYFNALLEKQKQALLLGTTSFVNTNNNGNAKYVTVPSAPLGLSPLEASAAQAPPPPRRVFSRIELPPELSSSCSAHSHSHSNSSTGSTSTTTTATSGGGPTTFSAAAPPSIGVAILGHELHNLAITTTCQPTPDTLTPPLAAKDPLSDAGNHCGPLPSYPFLTAPLPLTTFPIPCMPLANSHTDPYGAMIAGPTLPTFFPASSFPQAHSPLVAVVREENGYGEVGAFRADRPILFGSPRSEGSVASPCAIAAVPYPPAPPLAHCGRSQSLLSSVGAESSPLVGEGVNSFDLMFGGASSSPPPTHQHQQPPLAGSNWTMWQLPKLAEAVPLSPPTATTTAMNAAAHERNLAVEATVPQKYQSEQRQAIKTNTVCPSPPETVTNNTTASAGALVGTHNEMERLRAKPPPNRSAAAVIQLPASSTTTTSSRQVKTGGEQMRFFEALDTLGKRLINEGDNNNHRHLPQQRVVDGTHGPPTTAKGCEWREEKEEQTALPFPLHDCSRREDGEPLGKHQSEHLPSFERPAAAAVLEIPPHLLLPKTMGPPTQTSRPPLAPLRKIIELPLDVMMQARQQQHSHPSSANDAFSPHFFVESLLVSSPSPNLHPQLHQQQTQQQHAMMSAAADVGGILPSAWCAPPSTLANNVPLHPFFSAASTAFLGHPQPQQPDHQLTVDPAVLLSIQQTLSSSASTAAAAVGTCAQYTNNNNNNNTNRNTILNTYSNPATAACSFHPHPFFSPQCPFLCDAAALTKAGEGGEASSSASNINADSNITTSSGSGSAASTAISSHIKSVLSYSAPASSYETVTVIRGGGGVDGSGGAHNDRRHHHQQQQWHPAYANPTAQLVPSRVLQAHPAATNVNVKGFGARIVNASTTEASGVELEGKEEGDDGHGAEESNGKGEDSGNGCFVHKGDLIEKREGKDSLVQHNNIVLESNGNEGISGAKTTEDLHYRHHQVLHDCTAPQKRTTASSLIKRKIGERALLAPKAQRPYLASQPQQAFIAGTCTATSQQQTETISSNSTRNRAMHTRLGLDVLSASLKLPTVSSSSFSSEVGGSTPLTTASSFASRRHGGGEDEEGATRDAREKSHASTRLHSNYGSTKRETPRRRGSNVNEFGKKKAKTTRSPCRGGEGRPSDVIVGGRRVSVGLHVHVLDSKDGEREAEREERKWAATTTTKSAHTYGYDASGDEEGAAGRGRRGYIFDCGVVDEEDEEDERLLGILTLGGDCTSAATSSTATTCTSATATAFTTCRHPSSYFPSAAAPPLQQQIPLQISSLDQFLFLPASSKHAQVKTKEKKSRHKKGPAATSNDENSNNTIQHTSSDQYVAATIDSSHRSLSLTSSTATRSSSSLSLPPQQHPFHHFIPYHNHKHNLPHNNQRHDNNQRVVHHVATTSSQKKMAATTTATKRSARQRQTERFERIRREEWEEMRKKAVVAATAAAAAIAVGGRGMGACDGGNVPAALLQSILPVWTGTTVGTSTTTTTATSETMSSDETATSEQGVGEGKIGAGKEIGLLLRTKKRRSHRATWPERAGVCGLALPLGSVISDNWWGTDRHQDETANSVDILLNNNNNYGNEDNAGVTAEGQAVSGGGVKKPKFIALPEYLLPPQ